MFKVRELVDCRVNAASGELELLVAWRGLKDIENAWEPARSIRHGVPALVAKYAMDLFKIFKPSRTASILKGDESLGDAFEALKLSAIPIRKYHFIEKKMVVNLLLSRDFNLWSKHAAALNKKDRYDTTFEVLTKAFGEKDVAIMILLGKFGVRYTGIRRHCQSLAPLLPD